MDINERDHHGMFTPHDNIQFPVLEYDPKNIKAFWNRYKTMLFMHKELKYLILIKKCDIQFALNDPTKRLCTDNFYVRFDQGGYFDKDANQDENQIYWNWCSNE